MKIHLILWQWDLTIHYIDWVDVFCMSRTVVVTTDLTFEIIGTSRFLCHTHWTKEAFHLLIFCFINFDQDTVSVWNLYRTFIIDKPIPAKTIIYLRRSFWSRRFCPIRASDSTYCLTGSMCLTNDTSLEKLLTKIRSVLIGLELYKRCLASSNQKKR